MTTHDPLRRDLIASPSLSTEPVAPWPRTPQEALDDAEWRYDSEETCVDCGGPVVWATVAGSDFFRAFDFTVQPGGAPRKLDERGRLVPHFKLCESAA